MPAVRRSAPLRQRAPQAERAARATLVHSLSGTCERRRRAYLLTPMGSLRSSAPMLVALLALFVALGGPAHAERLISGAKIKRNTVASKQIKDRSVKSRDLSRATVRALQATPNGSISDAKVATGAVTSRALAFGSVQSAAIADGAVGAGDLGANSVGADELADNAAGQAEIRGNGVAAAEIADNSIDGGEIIDGGLSVRDVARQVGTLAWTVKTLDKGECEVQRVPLGGAQIAGDFVLISPVTAWPLGLVYAANTTNIETEFKVEACNSGTSAVASASYTFNYAIIGF
jgi:hypothetical protein